MTSIPGPSPASLPDEAEAQLAAAQGLAPPTAASVAAATAGGLLMYVLLKARGLLLVPLYARMLDPHQLGVASLAAALATLLAPVLHFGMPGGMLVELPHLPPAHRARAYRTSLKVVSGAVAAGVLLIGFGLPRMGEWPWIDEVRPHALAVAFLVGGTVMRDMATVLPQLYRHTRFLMGLNLSIEYGGAAVGLTLIARGWGAAGLLWGAALGSVGGAAAGLRHSWRLSTPGAGWELRFVGTALSVGAPLFGIGVAQWAVQGVDRLFLAHYHGAATVGVYGLSYGVASGILAVAATVNLIFLPVSVSLHATPERLRRFVEASLRLTIVCLGLCVAGAFLTGRWAMSVLAGAAYSDGGRVLPLMVLSYALFTVLQLLQWIPMAIERRVAGVAGCYATMAGLNILLDFVLIPRAGMKGAVLAAIVAHLCGAVVMAMLARAALPFSWRPALRAVALVGAAAGLGAMLAIPSNATTYAAVAATGALLCCYAAASLALGAIRKDDLLLVRSALRLARAEEVGSP